MEKSTSEKNNNPCINCGACCAFFRVAFYWREIEGTGEWIVPEKLTVDLDHHLKCMKGTEIKHRPKCIGLTGKIGKNAICSIYESRPTPCRSFQASYIDGAPNFRCNQARLAHGLKPLRREDWIIDSSSHP